MLDINGSVGKIPSGSSLKLQGHQFGTNNLKIIKFTFSDLGYGYTFFKVCILKVKDNILFYF